MSFAAVRRTFFVIHMWVGLVLGILLAALGLSGSLLVYDDAIADFLAAPPAATTAGQPLPLQMIADTAREAARAKGVAVGQLQISIPQKPTEAVSVRIGQISPMGNMPGMNNAAGNGEGRPHRRHHREGGDAARQPAQAGGGEGGGRGGLQVFIDPVSGEVLGTRKALLPPILVFAHQLHGNFFLGRDGRSLIVGWLGVAMLLLGATGLMLWWPRRGQWKYAFFVRRTARGLRFHRELHAATGIWIFVIFMIVSWSGLVLAWPQTLGAQPAGFNPRSMPTVEPNGGKPIGPDQAIALAKAAVPGLVARNVTLPAREDQPISISYLSNGAMNASVLVDPWAAKVIAVRDPSKSVMAWMRPVHQGALGPVWKFLVFLSGLVPALFVTTGIIMWAKKRRRRIPMNTLSDDVSGDEVPA